MRSGKQNAAVEMRWAELLDENMPQELRRSIEEQKTACDEIVASKARERRDRGAPRGIVLVALCYRDQAARHRGGASTVAVLMTDQ